jgi:hypothetical protein
MLHRSPLARFGLFAFTLALCVVVAGCGAGAGRKSRVTKENFDKIKVGMSQDDVVDLLGKGQPVGDGGGAAAAVGVDISGGQGPSNREEYTWTDGDKSINVTFRKEKVVGKTEKGLKP